MKKGSEWNIWDLHVHTPASLVHHFEAGDDCDVWEQYIRDLESLPKEVKVLGIKAHLPIRQLWSDDSRGRPLHWQF